VVFVELGVMMLLGLVVLFLVIRPLVKRILAARLFGIDGRGAPLFAMGFI
jgi:flagellar M-ring protein FliF